MYFIRTLSKETSTHILHIHINKNPVGLWELPDYTPGYILGAPRIYQIIYMYTPPGREYRGIFWKINDLQLIIEVIFDRNLA